MSQQSPERRPLRAPARPAPYAIAAVLVAVSVVVPLMVATYAKATPTLWGFPFFYWYQLMWVFIAAGLMSIAYTVVTREDRRRREEARKAAGLADGTNGNSEVTR